MINMSVDLSQFKLKVADLKAVTAKAMPLIHAEFIKNTPIRTGNARAHTSLNGKVITADYPYAERLDNGWSNQAPDGMTHPTEEFAQRLIPQIVQQLANRRNK